jgi:hypothetical protein
MEDQNQPQDQNPNQGQQGANGNGPDNTGKTVPYERFQKVNDAKKAAEETLSGIVTELLEDIPEDLRDIVPDLPPAEKIKWIRAAHKKGVFGGRAPEPNGPDSKRPGGKPPVDYSNMTPQAIMATGYKS